jgi:O-antigen/teichoic acid export membrane protein
MPVITKNLLIKNSFLNITGQSIPLLVTFFSMPYIVNRLGMERFGMFAIARVLIDYFTIFDFGFGVAATKFIAEALGKNDHLNVSRIYWTSLFLVVCLGLIGVCLFYFSAPILLRRFFIVSAALLPELITVAISASPIILFLLIKSLLIGTVQAYQRFDLVNICTIPNAIFSAMVPVGVLYSGGGLKEIIIGLVAVEFIFAIIWFFVSVKLVPTHKFQGFMLLPDFKKIVIFGFWLITQRIMLMIQFNTYALIIGMLISVSMVGYYSIPYSLATKIGLIGAGIAPVIFPAASLLAGLDQGRAKRLFHASLKYMMILYGLGCLVLIVFAREILVLWVGNDFIKSILVTQILAASMFLAGIGWVCSIFIQIENPRFLSLLTFILTPLYLMALWILTKKFSFNGPGYAWFFLSLSSVLIYMWYFIKKKYITSLFSINIRVLIGIFCLVLIVLLNLLIKYVGGSNYFIIAGNMMLLIIAYSIVAWIFFVDTKQKDDLIAKIKMYI